MDDTLEEQYFRWLYHQIDDSESENPAETYWKLARQLHEKEFVWIIPHDDNRIEDGRELRYTFAYETEQRLTPEWHSFPVSVLEVLIGLSHRLSFQLDETPQYWFWKLIWNLDLSRCTDKRYPPAVRRGVDEILDRVIWRTYEYSGEGGLFPLDDPHEDQRRVELWDQMSAYVIERL